MTTRMVTAVISVHESPTVAGQPRRPKPWLTCENDGLLLGCGAFRRHPGGHMFPTSPSRGGSATTWGSLRHDGLFRQSRTEHRRPADQHCGAGAQRGAEPVGG